MGTYYPTSTAEIDVLSTPYTQDGKFTSYPESNLLHNNMMMYLTPNSSNGNFSDQISSISGRNEMMFIPPTGDSMTMQENVKNVGNSVPEELQFMSRNQIGIMEGEQTLEGLSLSLNTQMSTPSFHYQYTNPGFSSVLSTHLPENNTRQMSFKVDESSSGNTIRFGLPNDNSQFFVNQKGVNGYGQYQYEQAGIGSAVLKSKYLKATQELLDEVVNVRDVVKRNESGKDQMLSKVDDGLKETEGNESSVVSGPAQELSSAEQQELQNKLEKLHLMLDEVDRRYKQYCHQMQILVTSFDVVAGGGDDKPYTSVAAKTISRHFRNLRNATTDQIQATRKTLGETDNSMGGPIPRLRYVDQKIRQQRSLHQFGMMRHAWRPQRGLPENAVTILRAWLFEHFLHPYPKDSEKIMLARQTGLGRGQVANWFINARVRLWKPMVEEMYKEEFGDTEINCSEENNTHKLIKENSWVSEDRRDDQDIQESSTSITHEAHDLKIKVNHNTETKTHQSSNSRLHMNTLVNNNHNHGFYPNDEGHLMVTSSAYQMSELGNFRVDNQVSLALGLQHREEDGGACFQDNSINEPGMVVGSSEYPYLELVNQQQNRFGNPHLLNDFIT